MTLNPDTAERLRRKLSLRKAAKVLAGLTSDHVSFASSTRVYDVVNEVHTVQDPLSIIKRELAMELTPQVQKATLEVAMRYVTLKALYRDGPGDTCASNHYEVLSAEFTALDTAARIEAVTDVYVRDGDVLTFAGRVRFGRNCAAPPAVSVQVRVAERNDHKQRHVVNYVWGKCRWRAAVIDSSLPLSKRAVDVHDFNETNFVRFERHDHLPPRMMALAEAYQAKIRRTYLGKEPVVDMDDSFDAAPLVGSTAAEMMQNRWDMVTSSYLLT